MSKMYGCMGAQFEDAPLYPLKLILALYSYGQDTTHTNVINNPTWFRSGILNEWALHLLLGMQLNKGEKYCVHILNFGT